MNTDEAKLIENDDPPPSATEAREMAKALRSYARAQARVENAADAVLFPEKRAGGVESLPQFKAWLEEANKQLKRAEARVRELKRRPKLRVRREQIAKRKAEDMARLLAVLPDHPPKWKAVVGWAVVVQLLDHIDALKRGGTLQ